MLFSSDSNISELSLKVEKNQSNTPTKSHHPLLRPFITFWRFSCYYAEYKARTRGH